MSTIRRRTFLAAGATAGAAGLVAPATSQAVASSDPGLPAPGPIYARHSNPADLGLLEAASLLRAGKLSSTELVKACQDRIARRNGEISFAGTASDVNAWIRTYPEIARNAAAAADTRLARARRQRRTLPALTGVPIGLKDLYAVKGLPVTASSKILGGDEATGVDAIAGNIASGNATVWRRLARQGMVLLGHTHTDEFAILGVTPQSGNPWDTARTTGGSSGGSAAALAARMTPAALGSDTLGSLRIPAAFCGVSSIKPTFGLLSSYGVIPMSWSLDTCGPMARSIADCSIMLSAMAGADPADPSTEVSGRPSSSYPTLPRRRSKPLAGTRIGVPTNVGTPDAGPGQVLARTYRELRALGATLVEVAIPLFSDSLEVKLGNYVDTLTYHSQWFPSRVAEYGGPAAQILAAVQAQDMRATDYLSLMRDRATYQATWKTFLAEHDLDAVALLVSTADPVERGTLATQSPLTNPQNNRLLTFMFNYLGYPTVTVPGGTSAASGLPVGIQIVGAPFSESSLIQLAIDLQARYPHYREAPTFA